MKTLLLQEPSGQLMFTPGMEKVYSNKDYKVYKSSFENHNYVIIRKFDDMAALVEDYTDTSVNLKFTHKLNGLY